VLMITGQSAATASCLAIDAGCALQALDYPKLRAKLLAEGQILTPPPGQPKADPAPRLRLEGIVVDDEAAQFAGTWVRSALLPPLVGDAYRHDGNSDQGHKSARFTPDLPVAGRYEVRLIYVANANRATNVPVTVVSADGEKTFTVNEQESALVDGAPRSLGIFRFDAGKKGAVVISNANANGYVTIDAVQFWPVKGE